MVTIKLKLTISIQIMKLIIGSEGNGVWGSNPFVYLLRKAYPGIEISFENTKDCDLILASHFNSQEPPVE
jgi:hypothetical protein